MPGGASFPSVSPYSKAQGGEFAADSSLRMKVVISGVSASATFPVTLSQTCTAAITTIAFGAAGTGLVLAAQGASTSIRVVGFSVCNACTLLRTYELRVGNTTPFWRGSMAGRLPFNWNMIGQNQVLTANKKITLYSNGAGTATATVYWKKA